MALRKFLPNSVDARLNGPEMNAINTSDVHEWFTHNATYSFLHQIDANRVSRPQIRHFFFEWYDAKPKICNAFILRCELAICLWAKNTWIEVYWKWFHFASYLLSIAHERRKAEERKTCIFWPLAIARWQQIYRRSSTCGICRGLTTHNYYRRSIHKSNSWWALHILIICRAYTRVPHQMMKRRGQPVHI